MLWTRRTTRIAQAIFALVVLLDVGHCLNTAEVRPREDSTRIGQAASDHWAFRSPQRPQVPGVSNRSQTWTRHPIDAFILARLEQSALDPSAEADRTTLIRRLSLDLLGLPPTPDEIEAFLKETRADAYERLVDRLLDSPHYGERSARFWLDLARFCESHGFEYDKMRENAWPYRDYVIRSFNADKPYTQFIREQLAGDVLEPATRDGNIATTFLTAGAWDEVGNGQVGQLMKTRVREEELEDIIGAVGQTFLGVTINCARCHDHKFDPIPQSDYYRVKAVFEGVRYGDRPILTRSELQSRSNQVALLNGRISESGEQIANIDREARLAILAQRKRQTSHEPIVPAKSSSAPIPLARWTFERDGTDAVGLMHGTLFGGAKVAKGSLVLNGKDAFLRTAPLPRDIQAKTLEVWLALSNLTQRGGAAISLEAGEGEPFDGIVFGERQARKWTAGSSSFHRTRDVGSREETALPNELIQLVIVYRADSSITIYRDGEQYGESYRPTGENATLRTYAADQARVLLGLRHTGGGNGFLSGQIEEASLYDRALSAEEVAASFRESLFGITPAELVQSMTDDVKKQRESLSAQVKTDRESLRALPAIPLAYAGLRQQPGPTHRLIRGDVETKGELVVAGALSVIRRPSTEFGLAPDAPEGERRRKFAEWVASPDNPLTARVMVNRIWQQHFGTGLVGTASDFGLNGERPTHPELLDWLAVYFMEHGWSIKQLHRWILTSHTYRQSSKFNSKADALDSDNRLLWHFAPRRLEGEAIRDAILVASGQLNREIGGPSFRPFELSSFGGSVFYNLMDRDEPRFNRRTVYRMNINSGKSPLLDAFDCPDPSVKAPSRRVTTTPLQALGLMNNSFVQRHAKHVAERVKKELSAGIPEEITLAYKLIFGREPNDTERRSAMELVRDHGMESVCWVLLNSSEFLYLR